MGYSLAFFLLGVVGAVWSRSWEMSGKTALVMVGVPYAAYFLAGCSPWMRTTSMLGTGMVLIGVPLSVGYSFHAMRLADDRGFAIIAFSLSLVSLTWVIRFGWRLLF